ncbi:MAG: hypothetical protein KIS79_01195 [Burkholderiales bacterium]|nr:hypothetical protein [Burkholderiales bacterium]
MREKTPGAYKQQRDGQRRAYSLSSSLVETYPALDQLVLKMTFSDPLGAGSQQAHMFAAGAKAFFFIACPCSICLEGGFDLESVVAKLVAARREQGAGELTCRGWRSIARDDEHRCLTKLSYSMSLLYKADSLRPG